MQKEYIFFRINFFLLILFLQQHKSIIKSNNKKSNYMNQLLRLPLLKYTHTEQKIHMSKKTKIIIITIIIIIKRKTVSSSLPKKKRSPRQQSKNRSLHCCRKDLHPRDRSYPTFSSFLCKCNLIKS